MINKIAKNKVKIPQVERENNLSIRFFNFLSPFIGYFFPNKRCQTGRKQKNANNIRDKQQYLPPGIEDRGDRARLTVDLCEYELRTPYAQSQIKHQYSEYPREYAPRNFFQKLDSII